MLDQAIAGTCDALADLLVGLGVPVLNHVEVEVVVDEVDAVEKFGLETVLVSLIRDLLDREHGNRVAADLHLGLQVLAEVIVDAEAGDVEGLADHGASLHRSQEGTGFDYDFFEGLPLIQHVLELLLVGGD